MRFALVSVAIALSACAHAAGTSRAPLARPTDGSPLLDPAAAYWQGHAPAVYVARLETTKGPFTLEIHRDWAPLGADHFYLLARAGFYNDSRFTRIVPRFIAQFGVPRDSALARLWYARTIPDDPVRQRNVRGTIAFAMTGPNARTTQLFISLVDNSRLDAQGFAPIGRVIDGMDVVDRLYGGYGENAGGGVRAGKQGPLLAGGNAYVDREFPRLDHLLRITVSERR
ncbi:MAG TPA: peptidylprolyl isomerase [Gemmatimonadaceae bacterium]|nr:peptidylprolyl isomerase [Gemmatimonadaceae bacterium]